MCGICGFTGNPDRELLGRMNARLRHRGPDDEGYYSDGLASLAARRLSIIDLEAGHQPIGDETGAAWVVFNGEIYNFKELRAHVEEKGHVLRTHSDTEVLVHLYEIYGEDFVGKLNGMFAIAIWDKKKETLFLFRDRVGVKPLYFALCGGQIFFASEIKALLEVPALRRGLNFDGLNHYFTFKHVPAPATAFQGIESVLPGERIKFRNGKMERGIYWRLVYQENSSLGADEAAEKILELLHDSVRLRMRSDVPVGALLSGGVDSGAVVALMKKVAPGARIKTFTLGYDSAPSAKEDDCRFARELAERFGTEHYEHIMSASELIQKLPQIVAAFDQPFSGVISTFFISQLAAQHVKTLLSGDGGDELFGSYLAARLAQPMAYYQRNRQAVLAGVPAAASDLLMPYENKIETLERLWRLDASEGSIAWRFSLYVFSEEDKKTLYSKKFFEGIRESSFGVFNESVSRLTSSNPLNRILELDIRTLLPDQVLPFVDRLSMAHSLEIRPPFLDYRLVEYAATIPGGMKIQRGVVKAILKKAAAAILPEEILDRPKEGFVMPIYAWMHTFLKDFIGETLSRERVAAAGFLDPAAAASLLEEHFSRKKDHSAKIWSLVMFQLWAEGSALAGAL